MYSIVLQALEAEMHGRWPRCEAICATGQDLVNGGHGARAEIGSKINNLMDKWKLLKELAALRRTKIEDGIEAHQVWQNSILRSWVCLEVLLLTVIYFSTMLMPMRLNCGWRRKCLWSQVMIMAGMKWGQRSVILYFQSNSNILNLIGQRKSLWYWKRVWESMNLTSVLSYIYC